MNSKTSSQDKYFNTINSLDFLLSNILGQIKLISVKEKNTPYAKLIELFLKGIELKEKLNSSEIEDLSPQINFIEGVNEEKI